MFLRMEKVRISKRVSSEAENFKKFAFQGNIFDLAIGVIIGTAFSGLVNSLVTNIFMPPIGYLTSKLDFSQLYVALGSERFSSLQEAMDSGAVVIRYGEVISVFISFLVTALIVYFFVFKVSKSMHKEEIKVKKSTKVCPECMSEIHKDAKRCPMCTSKL